MSKKEELKEEFKLEVDYPEKITKTDIYNVKRTINGVQDTIRLVIFSDEDIKEMEDYAAEYYAGQHNKQNLPSF